MEEWLACLAELGIPNDNPAWVKAAPTPELYKPFVPYSPMILPGFNKEEYMNWVKEDKDVANVVVPPISDTTQPMEEAEKTAAKGAGKGAT